MAADPWSEFRGTPAAAAPAVDPWADFRAPAAAGAITAAARSPEADIGAGIVGGGIQGTIQALGMPGDLRSGANYVADKTTSFIDPLVEKVMGFQPGEMGRRRANPDMQPRAQLPDLPNSADVTGFVEKNVGAIPKGRTPLGKFAQSITELVPTTAAFGGLRSGADALINVIFPGIASEAAGQATANTPAEPWARAAAGLGANVAGAIPRTMASAPERMVQSATRGMTPAQWDEAQRVSAIGAGPVGVPLSGPEAVAQAAGGSKLTDILRTVEGSTHGGQTTQRFFAQRPQQIEGAVGRTLDTVGPQDPRPSTLGPRISESAQNVIDETERGINAATRPAYNAASQHAIDPADFAPIASDPAFQASLRRLRNDEVLGPTYANQADNSVAVIDAVTKDMRDRGVALGNSQNPGFSSQTAGIYGRGSAEARDIARDPARGGVQAYDDALTAQQQARRENLKPLEQGPVGAVARVGGGGAGTLGGTEAAAKVLLPPAGTNAGGQGEIRDAVARMVMESAARDPNVVPSTVRQGLANAYDQAAAGPMNGLQEYAGAKFRAGAYGSPQQRANVDAAVGALPNGAAASQELGDLMTVLQATGQRKQPGSPTAFNTEINREMREMPLAFEAATHPLTVAKDRMQRLYLGRNQGRLADMFVAPDSVGQLRGISERQLGSPILEALTRSAVQAPTETRAR